MNKQTGQQKNTDRYPSQALSSDCCEYSKLRELGAETEGSNWKLSTVGKMCGLTMWDGRETDHE
jgi:hypothetical protein